MPNNSKTTSNLITANSFDAPPRRENARAARAPARTSRRKAALLGGLLLLFLLPGFISLGLGLWQWRKAEVKTTTQLEFDRRSGDAPVVLPTLAVDGESLRFRRAIVHGTYDAARQVMIDNRLHQEQAGYHVITPLRLAGSNMHLLVNRGWLPAAADHHELPAASVPQGFIELTGIAVVPGQRFFNLAAQPASGWEPVWQNLDLKRFHQVVSYPLHDVVIQLDPGAPRPDERAERHRSYALQWFGFAAASLGIWIYFLVRRP